jgi:hypothetical protein
MLALPVLDMEQVAVMDAGAEVVGHGDRSGPLRYIEVSGATPMSSMSRRGKSVTDISADGIGAGQEAQVHVARERRAVDQRLEPRHALHRRVEPDIGEGGKLLGPLAARSDRDRPAGETVDHVGPIARK